MSREYGMWTESWPLGLRFQHLGLVINHFFLRIDRWRTGSGTMGKGRTLGNAEQISRFLEAKSDNTSMKRKFTESVAHGGSSKVFKVGDGKRNWIVRERKSEHVHNCKAKTHGCPAYKSPSIHRAERNPPSPSRKTAWEIFYTRTIHVLCQP